MYCHASRSVNCQEKKEVKTEVKVIAVVKVKVLWVLLKLYIILRHLFIFPGMTQRFLKCCLLDFSPEINVGFIFVSFHSAL